MNETVMVLSLNDFQSLGAVRTVTGLRAAVHAGEIWLRGVPELPKADPRVRKLPARKTYALAERDLLFSLGARTPEMKLPELNWQPIAQFVPVESPVSAMPGELNVRLPLRLVRTEKPQKGEALRMALAEWKAYAEWAPAHRLQVLKFAVSVDGEVLVLGTPLPAIPGKEYWMNQGMLIPAGYDLEYPALAGPVAERLNPIRDGLVLLETGGAWDKIHWADFVPASRSAIRLTETNP